MIFYLLALAMCCQQYAAGDVSLTVDNGSRVRGNLKYTPNNDRFESSFAVTPGARGLEPPRPTPIYQRQEQAAPVLKDSYQHPIRHQPVLRFTQQIRQPQQVGAPSRYYLAPLVKKEKTNRNQTARLVHRKPSRRQRLRSKYQDCEPEEEEEEEEQVAVETVPNHPDTVQVQRRPAIQQHFYDVEHKVIVRPVGTAVIELDQAQPDTSFTQVQTEEVVPGQNVPDETATDQDATLYSPELPTDQDATVYSQDSPTLVYHQQGVPVQFGHHHQYGPQVPVYGFEQPQYPPVYTHHYPQGGYYPQEEEYYPQEGYHPHHPHHPHLPHHPQYIPPLPPGPTHEETPTVVVSVSDSGFDGPSNGGETPQTHVITTPLPCPPSDSELIEPHAPAEHPESTTTTSITIPAEHEHKDHHASEVLDLEAPAAHQTQNTSKLVDVVYANNSNQNLGKPEKLQQSPAVHYSPDQADADQIYQHEAYERGDSSPKSAYHADQPDQFHHDDEPNVKIVHRGQPIGGKPHNQRHRSNEERLLDLYSVRGGVSEVAHHSLASGHSPGRLQLAPASLNQRARVISVTPAPDHEAQYESRERSQIRRVVVSKPIERLVPPAPVPYGQRLSTKNAQRYEPGNPRPVYGPPVAAHLKTNQPTHTN